MICATISIISHNQIEIVKKLLSDITSQTISKKIEIILTLNTFETFNESMFKNLNIKIIKNRKPKGFGANHNQAFEHAKSEIFLIVNPDIRLIEKNSLEKMILETKFSNTINVPLVMAPNGSLEDSIRQNLTPLNLIKRICDKENQKKNESYKLKTNKFKWAAGMFIVCRKDLYQRLNGFNKKFYMYCEDYDFMARAYVEGIYLHIMKDIKVIHEARRDSHRSLKYMYWHLSSIMRVWKSKVFWEIIYISYFKILRKK